MPRLQEQLDELELLQSVLSSPGEFEIEDRASHEQAEAYVNGLTPDPPKFLSCRLCVLINAHQDSDDESAGCDDERASSGNSAGEHSISISVRLASRLVLAIL